MTHTLAQTSSFQDIFGQNESDVPFTQGYYRANFFKNFLKREPQTPPSKEEIQLMETLKSALLTHTVRNLMDRIAGSLSYKIVDTLLCYLKGKKSGLVYQGKKYIYNTYKQWAELFEGSHSEETIRKYMRRLEKVGLVESCQPEYFNRRKWYRVNLEKLKQLVIDKDEAFIATIKESFIRKKNVSKASQEETGESSEPIFSLEAQDLSAEDVSLSSATFPLPSGTLYPLLLIIHSYLSLNKSNKSKENFNKNEERLTEEVCEIRHNPWKKPPPPVEDKKAPPKRVFYDNEVMLHQWNLLIGKRLGVIMGMNQTLAKRFNGLLKHKLNGEVELWEKYCEIFARNDFWFQGHPQSGWKINLEWMLRFDIWDKHGAVLLVEKTQQDMEKKEEHERLEALQEHLKAVEETEGAEALALRQKVVEHSGSAMYGSWVQEVSLHIREKEIWVVCPTPFTCRSLENKSFSGVPPLEALWSAYRLHFVLSLDEMPKDAPKALCEPLNSHEADQASVWKQSVNMSQKIQGEAFDAHTNSLTHPSSSNSFRSVGDVCASLLPASLRDAFLGKDSS
jgi:hypothetical protein